MIDARARQDLTVEEARRRVLAEFGSLPASDVSLDDAFGLTLARDIVAARDLPPFANSAMDGYALVSTDTVSASESSPVALTVAGEIPAGHVGHVTCEPGRAVRIMTGAPVPPGADAVERVEHVELLDSGRVVLRQPVRGGANIRPAGEDIHAGETVLTAGTRLHAGGIGLLAATGHAYVPVHRRPRIGVLVTGDEVVAPGAPLGPGQIWNSNGPLITAQIRDCGGIPVSLGTVGDTADDIRDRIVNAGDLDMIITTGGVSVGDFDIVRNVLQSDGDIALWRLRIRPGKPLAFGRIGGTVVLGLPGNPVAAAVGFWQFGRAAILTMLGVKDTRLPEIDARVADRIVNRGGCTNYVRVQISRDRDDYVARLAGAQGSAMLTSLARADGLLVIPAGCEIVEPGMRLRVQMPYRF